MLKWISPSNICKKDFHIISYYFNNNSNPGTRICVTFLMDNKMVNTIGFVLKLRAQRTFT